ncbi:MAG: 1-acyl-sn-glycerol-3-phosphate acyltransferase [Pseudomonadota bacterium]
MTQTVQLPLWLFVLILLFAAVTALSHFLIPSVRWFFRRRLERAVDRLNKRLTRPIEPFKLARRSDMIQRLIYDPEVSQAILEHARKEGVPESVAFETAKRYAREIVPSFSAFTYFSFGTRAARWLANLLYDVRTGADNEKVLKAIPSDATVVFIMNHRSNMDYVLVTYLAAQASALSYAVGEWARIWPLSRLFKSMGAFFIRRKSRGALYRKVLARYVYMATKGGVTQAIFPEGGLSLNGLLMPPKMGLVSYVIEAAQSGCKVVFVPVAINYDRVLEDRVLIAAYERGDRRFGARVSVLLQFIAQKIWLAVRRKFVRFGAAAVVFGPHIPLETYSLPTDLEEVADDLVMRIRALMPALAVPLLARHLLESDEGLSEDTLVVRLTNDLAKAQLPDLEPALDPAAMVATGLGLLKKRGMVGQSTGHWRAVAAEQKTLSFYANSISHHFSPEPTFDAAPAKKISAIARS